ncbi:hypothetical protein C2845_PM12G25150 [Panicum miliaceum]|uniref:3-beta hydroxysteroid dehydrogenase/isomerase domain-containing protein n=1 Tax=Panicum miliaceum TaxID=4540 RepID=A0A3L6QKF1_PANMI|nr:hypothetical protein C2845_PM12G25150 [Panicum miliaceum]
MKSKFPVLFLCLAFAACSANQHHDPSVVGYSQEDLALPSKLLDLFTSWSVKHSKIYASPKEKVKSVGQRNSEFSVNERAGLVVTLHSYHPVRGLGVLNLFLRSGVSSTGSQASRVARALLPRLSSVAGDLCPAFVFSGHNRKHREGPEKMHLSANEGIEGVRFVVTGGQGFVGAALCLELLRRGAREVRSLDLRAASPCSQQLLDAGVRIIQGDIRKKDDVGRALRGVDCVFHLASYGMSGKEMVQAGRADEVNINGTCNVLDACHEHCVRRLVYPPISKFGLCSSSVTLAISRIFLFMSTLFYPWLDSKWIPQPIILPAEVYKVGVTHYFSFLKARNELGYVPMVSPQEGLAATISYWQEQKRRELDGPTIFTWLAVIIGMLAIFSAACLPPVGPLKWVLDIHLFVFRSLLVIRLVFAAGVAAHVGEAVYAWFLAKKVDPRNAAGWFWQTFALGFFSLRYLLKRARG